jgi:TIR domain
MLPPGAGRVAQGGSCEAGIMTTSTPAPPRIFISYRRQEAGGHAGRLSDRLIKHFSRAQIFQDIDSIQPGDDFAEAIADAVASCQVLLAVIGDQWLNIEDSEGHRRLDNPQDFVRLEIEAALRHNIRVIPILIDRAPMPRADQLPASLAPLAGRQAHDLSSNRDRFKSDVAHLLKALDKYFSKPQTARPLAAKQRQPIPAPPASAKPVPSTPDEIMASLSPDERASLEKIKDPQQRMIQMVQLALEKQSLHATALTNIAQMRHDMLKGERQNFRA